MKRNKSVYEYLLEKYRGVADDVEQGEKLAIDTDGYRWAKCISCGKIANIEYFANCGFEGNINQGKCRECVSELDGYRKLHGYRKLPRTTRPLTDSMEDLEILAQTYRQQEEN